MASWSKRRRLIYAAIVALILLAAVGVPAFLIFYTPPSCSDGMKNGSEQGIDCGGSCERLCPSAFLSPGVAWTRFAEVAPGLYHAAAYIINPNVTGMATGTPFHLAFYDARGVLITDIQGRLDIPPHRNTLAFLLAVDLAKRLPAKILFEFTAIPNWRTAKDSLQALQIVDKKYNEDAEGASLAVTLGNTSVEEIGPLDVFAVLYDKEGNALGFSKTIVDQVPPQGTALAPFTWPKGFGGKVISIEVLPVAQ